MRNGRDVMVNFDPNEYMRKMIFQVVTQAAHKKRDLSTLNRSRTYDLLDWLLVQMRYH